MDDDGDGPNQNPFPLHPLRSSRPKFATVGPKTEGTREGREGTEGGLLLRGLSLSLRPTFLAPHLLCQRVEWGRRRRRVRGNTVGRGGKTKEGARLHHLRRRQPSDGSSPSFHFESGAFRFVLFCCCYCCPPPLLPLASFLLLLLPFLSLLLPVFPFLLSSPSPPTFK